MHCFSSLPRALVLLMLLFAVSRAAPAASAQQVIISEFLAANATGKADGDGDLSDWIELYNPSSTEVNLTGWSLTDDPANPRKWIFPATALPPHSFLLVFASGKNRTNATELHTSFSLAKEGEYLALINPAGVATSEFAPSFPPQPPDVSYGSAMHTDTETFVRTNSPARVFAPVDNSISATWMSRDFPDAVWRGAISAVGYDRIAQGASDPSEPVSVLEDVTRPGDPATPTTVNSPQNETVINAIDNNPATKYLNFDKLNSGFTVTPSSGSTVVRGLRLTSANDAPERDPASFVLFGSLDGHAFTEVARGPVPQFLNRFTTVEVSFSNTSAFAHYRLIFPTIRNAAGSCCVQIAEVEFLGLPETSAASVGELVGSNIEDMLFNRRSTAYLRVPFTLPQLPSIETLQLLMHYDDGFIAYLNGTRIASANAPTSPTFESVSTTNRYRRDVVRPTTFNITGFTNLLRAGENVLAIQGFNDRKDGADFLLRPQLQSSRVRVGDLAYYAQATPGAANGQPLAGLVAAPLLSHPRGFYEAPFDLTLFTPTQGAEIRYTTNGDAPTPTNGIVYTSPVRISRTTPFRSAAFRAGWRSSEVISATFLFLNDVVTQTRESALAAGFPPSWNSQPADYGLSPAVVGPNDSFGGNYSRSIKNDLKTIPTISLVMNMGDVFGPQGIYANPESRGEAWERPVSLEILYPDGTHVQEDAGIRIQGGAFRRFDLSLKKSFRVVFREQYGASKFQFPLFGPDAADEFQNFVLRANSNDAWGYGGGNALYMRDAFAMESLREMGSVSSHLGYAHLYINGQYWGLYNPVERPDAAFSATYFGGDRDTWDALNQDSAPDGNYDAWNRLIAGLSQDVSRTDVYQRLQGNNPDGTRNPAYEDLIDVDNLIDYMIVNIYMGNTDWPHRNWWAGRDRNNGDGFKFYPWDTETSLAGLNTDVTGVSQAVTQPYAALRRNADFRLRFADHVHRHFFNGGVFYVNPASPAWTAANPTNNRPAARMMAISSLIRDAVVGESARWGDQMNTPLRTRDEHWAPALNALVRTYFPARSATVLNQLRNAGLYPRTAAPVMNVRGGQVEPGFKVTLSAPAGIIYYSTNAAIDPRNTNAAVRYVDGITISDLTTLRARALNGAEWSALEEATFTTGTPSLTISEIHYNPAPPTPDEIAAGFTNANEFEFLEILNNGAVTYDLSGFAFASGVQFVFPEGSLLKPGEHALLVNNAAAIQKRYGAAVKPFGVYTGRLDNSGERLRIVNRAQEPVVDIVYRTTAAWPIDANGGGYSLELRAPTADPLDVQSWRRSLQIGGSPGAPNPPAPLLLNIRHLNGELILSFDPQPGRRYSILSTTSLSNAQWSTLQALEPATSAARIDLRLAPGSATTQFYRVVQQ
ncbi:MAG TPA: lamin tail domain-containing protein [Methylomirabilota bacterium]|nr:lamin tail domain-containing protein [Methylomirabilota bacterium]